MLTPPAIASSGDNVYVVWRESISSDNTEILYRRSTDGGATFGSVINLSNNPSWSGVPAIAAFENNVYVVWDEEVTSGTTEILYTRSIDGGNAFESTKNLANNAGFPTIAASGDNVHVVISSDAGILYKRSTDSGATFGSTINLSDDIIDGGSPAIAVSESSVNVVWFDSLEGNEDNWEIFYARSTDGGITFDGTINISNTEGHSQVPSIASSKDNIYVTWADNSSGNNEILYRTSSDGGVSFGSTINVSNNQEISENPDMAIFGTL